MLNHTDRTRAGHILWNLAIVVALIAAVKLFIDNRVLWQIGDLLSIALV